MNLNHLASLGKLFLFAVFLILTACGGGGSSSDGVVPSNPSAYPTGPDANEAGAGNNSIATATNHTLGNNAVNTIWPQGDVDYYAVALTAGTEYEFSANHLCTTCDVYLYLIDSSDTLLNSNDDYIGFDSRILFTPTLTGTYYVMVRAFDPTYGVAQYTFSARVFTDSDGDGYSSYYDCNDGNSMIYPYAFEVPGDGIDQNCSGVDQLVGTTVDSAEVDNTPATARELTPLPGSYLEIQYLNQVFMNNARTLSDTADEDWFTITVPAFSASIVGALESSGVFMGQIFEADATTPASSLLVNPTGSPMRFYVRIYGTDTSGAWAVLAPMDLGQDLDGDGFYSHDWDISRDCNDGDSTVYPGAIEIVGDGIDQNCDDSDFDTIPFRAIAPKEHSFHL